MEVAREDLRQRILDCRACGLWNHGKRPTPFKGPAPCEIAVLGMAPGEDENRRGEPFVGRAGQLLDRILGRLHVLPSELFFLNAVSCWPENNRVPEPGEMAACRTLRLDQLALAQPRFLIALGDVALRALRPDLRIGQMHGKPLWYQQGADLDGRAIWWSDLEVFVCYHPSAALRGGDYESKISSALYTFFNYAEQGSLHGLYMEECVQCHSELARYDSNGVAYCAGHGRQDSLL